jgi:hypothetical protein
MTCIIGNCVDCSLLGEEVLILNNDFEEVPTGFYTCNAIKHKYYGCTGEPPDGVHVVDGSGYYAALRVPKDFGCKHFKQKEV